MDKRGLKAILLRHETILFFVLVAEWIFFDAIGRNFATYDTSCDILRHSCEIGLLALAMTPVILTGGIDLSVGTLLGLCAILFGKFYRDAHLPIPIAAACTICVGALAGGLNASLITWLRLPPLIVTLGTFSLFRGLAEAITHGVDTFTDFPNSFLFLGQERWLGIPAQAPVFILAAIFFWLLVHRTTFGRSFRATGFAPEGARYAGIPVKRRIAMVYVLAGITSAIAAIIYTARLGQAKADAGTGYELFAITAVVLGGTSIFGGNGTICGTLLGVAAIAVLDSGLFHARMPSEMAGMLTGVLLILALTGSVLPKFISSLRAKRTAPKLGETNPMKKIISLLFLTVAVVFSGCNKPEIASADGNANANPPTGKKLTIALLPKSKGNAYFISCSQGADKAAKELGDELIFDGPTDTDPAKQNEIVENWITLGVDVIAAACENKEGISTALRKAQAKGIKVITYDADALPDARQFFVNQATPQGIGYALMDQAAQLCESNGEFAIITASLTAANQQEWQKYIEEDRAANYPNMKMIALRPCDDLKDKAQSETTALLGANPNLKLVMAICSPGVPGAAEAVKQAGKTGTIKVIGLGLPNENKMYVHDGVTQAVILWNTMDLGYLTVYAADALARGNLKTGDTSFKAGTLGTFDIKGDNILLGKPFVFTKDNIDQFNF